MNKTKTIIIGVALLTAMLFNTSLLAQSAGFNDSVSGKWSAYQGLMYWNDAKKKCASIGMRLPTRGELVAAHKAGL